MRRKQRGRYKRMSRSFSFACKGSTSQTTRGWTLFVDFHFRYFVVRQYREQADEYSYHMYICKCFGGFSPHIPWIDSKDTLAPVIVMCVAYYKSKCHELKEKQKLINVLCETHAEHPHTEGRRPLKCGQLHIEKEAKLFHPKHS